MTYKEILLQAEAMMNNSDLVNNYHNDLKMLLAHHAKMSLAELYGKLNTSINFSDCLFLNDVKKYQVGFPLQYLTHSQYFYGNNFYVDSNVLIPRYETEELVENISNIISDHKIWKNQANLTIFDVGTGSGAIGISLALDHPKCKVYGSDISLAAISVAQKNKRLLNCRNIRFLTGDMLNPFMEKKLHADVLICNPPYIPDNQEISAKVKDFEPHVALFGHETGLYFYHQIFNNYRQVMNKPGILCFEHGYDQKKQLEKLVHQYFPHTAYEFVKDINKKWRMLFIYFLE